MKTTAIALDYAKTTAAIFALAAAFFFGYSVLGYVSDVFDSARAASCSTCGGTENIIIMWDGGGGGWSNTHYDGGGGGGGGFYPYCTLAITRGPMVATSYPPQYQYTITWTAPYASAFSISNGIGSVTPATGGSYTFSSSITSGTYTGTATTPYGTVNCSGDIPPVPQDPPYCDISASPATITSGSSSVIAWNTTKGTSFSINNGVGSLTPVGGGSVTVSPAVTTTYTGTVVGAGGTATCQTVVVVNKTPPQCTLDLTKDTITWTSTNAFQVLIAPLTNSPQIPGLSGGTPTTVAHTEGDAYTTPVLTDITQNGGTTLPGPGIGFASDQTTMNRVCVALHGVGSTATNIGARSYNSCGNNAVVKFNGTSWSVIPACSFNSHLSSSFSCVTGGGIQTYPLNGSHTFVPPLGTGTHTYKLTATGQGGTVMCEDTVVVEDPGECKLEITKSANETTVMQGDTVEYTIHVKNSGNKKCTGSGVKIQDVLDSNLIYQSETHSSNITAGYQSLPLYQSSIRTLSWNAWDLDPNETGWIKVVVKAGTLSACEVEVPNKAKITSYEYNNFGTWVYSNVVKVTAYKDCTPPPPTECKLEISKSANKATTTPNGLVEYTINFKNTGNKKCTGSGVKVQDVLDSNLIYQSVTHSSNVTAGYQSLPVYQSSNRTVSFNAWDLDPNESGWVKIVVKAGTPTACTTEVPNKAKITAYEYDNFTTWVYSNIVTLVIDKNCQPPSTCSPGYWKNHLSIWYDASDPHDVQLLTWLNAQGPGSDVLRNNAAAYLNAEFPGQSCDDTPPPPEECKLEITKSANKSTVSAYDTVEYTIHVKNTGSKKCTGSGVKLQDVLDAGLIYQSETHSENITAGYLSMPVYQSSNRTLSWNAWDLDINETGWVKFVAKAATPTACTETVPNKAKITALEYDNFTTWVYSNIVNVTVTKDCHVPVPYCTMSIDPTSLATPGAPATLTWNTTNVSTATIDQGVGSVALSGTKVVNPTANTTYTGTFTGPGGTVTCQATITLTQQPTPMCTLSVSAPKIKTGESVMVSWTAQNVSQGFINSVGTTSPVFGGSAEVFPADSTTYTGTFTGSYGAVTCSAPVTVEKGGGGCQGNCGGGLNQPNVVMLQKPPEAPLAFVTLEQIPYTGFEAGKALTLAFWLAIGLLAAAITYFVMGRGALTYVMSSTLASAGIGAYDQYEEQGDAMPRPVPSTVREEARRDSAAYNGSSNGSHYAASVAAPAPVYTPVAVAPAPAPAPLAVAQVTDIAEMIESRAHAAGVLMSPEAVQSAIALSKDRGEVLRQFGEIINEAVRTLPREDGWVMLTSERFDAITETAAKPVTRATPTSTPSVEAILNSVMPPVAPTLVVNVEMPMANTDEQSVVMALARTILSGNREQAYTTLRNLEAGRANAATVMTVIAGATDQLYRARRHGLTTELSTAAIDISDETLMKIVEVFTHGMDAAYSNPFTSLKLAVAQAFEARG
jgi:uncharacterized repeat protein (TIGR01451 family)